MYNLGLSFARTIPLLKKIHLNNLQILPSVLITRRYQWKIKKKRYLLASHSNENVRKTRSLNNNNTKWFVPQSDDNVAACAAVTNTSNKATKKLKFP